MSKISIGRIFTCLGEVDQELPGPSGATATTQTIRGRENTAITEQEVADRYAATLSVVHRWRQDGTGPAWVQCDGTILYRQKDLEAWDRDWKM